MLYLAIFCALSAAASGICLIGTIYVARSAKAVQVSLLARLRSCESRTESLAASVEEWSKITESTAQSLKMAKVRRMTALPSSSGRADDEPDPHIEPDRWRQWANRRFKPFIAGSK